MNNIGIDLQDKVILVTGAARGLGRAIALGLATHGGQVCALDRQDGVAELDGLAAEAAGAGARHKVLPLVVDITVPEQCAEVVEQARARLGGLDALINNAGVGMELLGPFLHTPPKFYDVPVEIWRKVVDTNINGTFYMSRAVAPLLVARSWGRIINTTGRLFVMLRKGLSPYGPTKAAMESATAIWSADLAGTGVTVNALSPGGLVDTRMIPAEDIKDRASLMRPDVMVPPAVWLCSTASDGVSGMRLTAKDWDLSLTPSEAAKKAAIPVLVGELPQR